MIKNATYFLWLLGILIVIYLLYRSQSPFYNQTHAVPKSEAQQFNPEITKTEEAWRQILTKQQYYVLREKGTDIPYTGTGILEEKRAGTYVTADCNEPVFRSEQKFESGTGWPSFTAPIEGSVVEIDDSTLGISRVEVVGRKCGGHLGHVFTDGPPPTGLRYCINASALKFIPDQQ